MAQIFICDRCKKPIEFRIYKAKGLALTLGYVDLCKSCSEELQERQPRFTVAFERLLALPENQFQQIMLPIGE